LDCRFVLQLWRYPDPLRCRLRRSAQVDGEVTRCAVHHNIYGGDFDFEPYGAAPKSLSEKTYENQPDSGLENNPCEFFVDCGIIWKLGIMPEPDV
jgi:hypothetical protein